MILCWRLDCQNSHVKAQDDTLFKSYNHHSDLRMTSVIILCDLFRFALILSSSDVCLFIRSEQHVDHAGYSCYRYYNTYYICLTGKQSADMHDAKCYKICKSTLVTNCKPCPLTAVHLTLDSTDRFEAGSTKEVEYQE